MPIVENEQLIKTYKKRIKRGFRPVESQANLEILQNATEKLVVGIDDGTKGDLVPLVIVPDVVGLNKLDAMLELRSSGSPFISAKPPIGHPPSSLFGLRVSVVGTPPLTCRYELTKLLIQYVFQ